MIKYHTKHAALYLSIAHVTRCLFEILKDNFRVQTDFVQIILVPTNTLDLHKTLTGERKLDYAYHEPYLTASSVEHFIQISKPGTFQSLFHS